MNQAVVDAGFPRWTWYVSYTLSIPVCVWLFLLVARWGFSQSGLPPEQATMLLYGTTALYGVWVAKGNFAKMLDLHRLVAKEQKAFPRPVTARLSQPSAAPLKRKLSRSDKFMLATIILLMVSMPVVSAWRAANRHAVSSPVHIPSSIIR